MGHVEGVKSSKDNNIFPSTNGSGNADGRSETSPVSERKEPQAQSADRRYSVSAKHFQERGQNFNITVCRNVRNSGEGSVFKRFPARRLSPLPAFSHLPPTGEGKYVAFTLAETLIALVIIGIIAAITIPAINRSSQKHILKNQFKKTYSTISNAVSKTDRDLGGNSECYYPEGATNADGTKSDCSAFMEQLPKNLIIQRFCNGYAKRNGCIPTPYLKKYAFKSYALGFSQSRVENNVRVYNLADGTIIIYYYQATYNYLPVLLVDINGAKGPNELGKDVFIFKIDSDGINGLKVSDNLLPYDWVENDTRSKAYFRYVSDIYKE